MFEGMSDLLSTQRFILPVSANTGFKESIEFLNIHLMILNQLSMWIMDTVYSHITDRPSYLLSLVSSFFLCFDYWR